ncbi:hypothetical protein [Dokdonella sp.]|uniref:hypothetical protein n=1 Tax=Dokdonella sp. TaxID=2291710 RepID=UPI0025BC0159|nr:hypothetical protein [Dokdonella sp.]MBX3693202.1 hypothetical protein [Dokdonella sp.]MCW5568319.1 hypothetical protein [Dokdonella sp.]
MTQVITRLSLLCLALAVVIAPALAVEPAKPKAEQAASNQREVEYPALERHVGKAIVVHTTNDTVRTGTLLKYTNVNLTIQLGPEAGSIELTVPRNTVRRAFVTVGNADPLFPNDTFHQETKPGAQKN